MFAVVLVATMLLILLRLVVFFLALALGGGEICSRETFREYRGFFWYFEICIRRCAWLRQIIVFRNIKTWRSWLCTIRDIGAQEFGIGKNVTVEGINSRNSKARLNILWRESLWKSTAKQFCNIINLDKLTRVVKHPCISSSIVVSFQWSKNRSIQGLKLVTYVWRDSKHHNWIEFSIFN